MPSQKTRWAVHLVFLAAYRRFSRRKHRFVLGNKGAYLQYKPQRYCVLIVIFVCFMMLPPGESSCILYTEFLSSFFLSGVLVAYRYRRKPHRVDVVDINVDVSRPRHEVSDLLLNLVASGRRSRQQQDDPD